MNQQTAGVRPVAWEAFSYYETYKAVFNASECEQIIELHRQNFLVQDKMAGAGGRILRDSDLFWIPRSAEAAWIFNKLWDVVSLYNSRYRFELSSEMGQAQLTRYRPGQLYEWHMDLGAGQLSLRKITAVVELTPKSSTVGGGIEVFYGQPTGNKVDLDAGDMVVFPSFVMHRASMVCSGTRWSLVLWLNGAAPLS